VALVFVPSKNSVFARLNILIPQKIKKRILYAIYPKSKGEKGFVAFYDQCTPFHMRKLCKDNDFSIIAERFYYKSSYFSFFFPAYFVWRLWVILFHFFVKEQAAETFSMALYKKVPKDII
jgi:2-polyprenyl-6-hydroxyphenyl methylase/3-demethylubiquinone-9 3-methyltransferase